MPKRFLKYMPRCENPRNLRIFHFCVIKIDLWSKFSNFKHLQKINEGQEWSKISIRAVFWHYEYNKRFIFDKFKSCIFKKGPKCGRNLSFFSTVKGRHFFAYKKRYEKLVDFVTLIANIFKYGKKYSKTLLIEFILKIQISIWNNFLLEYCIISSR